jgi:hypothetical protein
VDVGAFPGVAHSRLERNSRRPRGWNENEVTFPTAKVLGHIGVAVVGVASRLASVERTVSVHSMGSDEVKLRYEVQQQLVPFVGGVRVF